MPGRTCSVCSAGADVRRQVDSMIIDGSSFRAIERHFQETPGLSRDSIRRHFLAHASSDVLSAMAESQAVSAASLVSAINDIAHHARDLRLELQRTGKHRESLRAGDAELRALTTLVVRLGITDGDLIAAVRETEDLVLALASVFRGQPELSPPLIEALRDRGADKLADAYLEVSRNKEISK